jgi:tRNA ligase
VQHRRELRSAIANIQPPVRLVALNWSLDQPPAMIHRICGDRVQARGENHQTLRPDERKSHEDVIWMFIEKTEGLAEEEVDEVIDMDVAEGLDEGLSRAVDGLVRILGVRRPGDEEMGAALSVARSYAPEGVKKDVGDQSANAAKVKGRERGKGKEKGKEMEKEKEKKEKSGKQPRYFGLLPELDLDAIVGGRLGEADAPPEAKQLWDLLKERGRVTRRPHITIVHSKSRPGEQALWDWCTALHRMATPPSFSFRLGHVVCNGKVVAVTVDGLGVERTEGEKVDLEAGAAFVEGLEQEVWGRLHITVGTRDASVNSYEAKTLVEEWRGGGKATVVALKDVEGRGRVKGLTS